MALSVEKGTVSKMVDRNPTRTNVPIGVLHTQACEAAVFEDYTNGPHLSKSQMRVFSPELKQNNK
jgi:hypothetical protein